MKSLNDWDVIKLNIIDGIVGVWNYRLKGKRSKGQPKSRWLTHVSDDITSRAQANMIN